MWQRWGYRALIAWHIFTCIDTRTSDNHHQNIISEPSDVSVTMGDEVTLPCDNKNNQDECQWTLDGVILGQELSLHAYPRFTILDSGCDLRLYPVLPKDQGMYVCRAMPAKTYQVTVLAEPGQPHIVQARLGTVLEVRVGEEVTLQCESLGGIPAAEIEWMLGGIQVTEGVTAMTSMIEDSKTYKTVSTITMKVLQDMTVTCLATSSAFAVKKTARLQIRLLHKPHVQISINQEDVREGMMVELMCNAEVYPPITNYKWFINKQELQEEDGKILKLDSVTREFDGVEVMCSVVNRVGYDQASIFLTVQYPPEIVAHPTDVVAKEGDTVTFTCKGKGNPSPDYIWLSTTTHQVMSFNQNLTLVATSTTEQSYTCRIFSDKFQPVDSTSASLTILHKPKIVLVENQETNEGRLVHCAARSVEDDTKIVWWKEEGPVNIREDGNEILLTTDGVIHHSYLMINSEPQEDVNYSCVATNAAGSVTQVVPHLSNNHLITYVLLIIFVTTIILLTVAFTVKNRLRRLERENVEKMEEQKKLHIADVCEDQDQPCLGHNNTNHGYIVGGLTPNDSWHSFHTISSVLAQAATQEQRS